MPPRTPAKKQRDLALISRLYVRGWTHAAIAKRVGISRAVVYLDLKTVRQHWLDQQLHSYNERKAEELEKIDALEREAWRAWRRSQSKQKRTRTEQSGDQLDEETAIIGDLAGATTQQIKKHVKASVQEQDRDGNPAFLDRIAWCIDKRCQIFGLDAPKKYAPTTTDGNDLFGSRPLGELTDGELVALILRASSAGSADQIIEAESSPVPALGLHDIHETGLPSQLAPSSVGQLPGPVDQGRDSEAIDLPPPSSREVDPCEPPFACPDPGAES